MKFSFLNQEANRLTPAANRVAICSSNLQQQSEVYFTPK